MHTRVTGKKCRDPFSETQCIFLSYALCLGLALWNLAFFYAAILINLLIVSTCLHFCHFCLPLVDVHFKWLHFNTVSLSSDTSIYSQYSQYTLQIDLFLFLRQTVQSFNVLKVNNKVKHINVKIAVYHKVYNTVQCLSRASMAVIMV